jgi:hypothetical protein
MVEAEPKIRPMRSSRGLLVFGVITGLLIGAALAAATTVVREPSAVFASRDTVQTGDHVFYHLTAFTEQGEIIFSSDPEVLEEAALQGKTSLEPTLGHPKQGLRNTTMWDAYTIPEQVQSRWVPQPYLHGLRVNDAVKTPLVYKPFGPLPVPALAKTFGPLSTSFTLNLAEAYSSENATRTAQDYGPRGGFEPGRVVPYMGTLTARVESIADEVAILTILVQGEETVHSDAFGFDMKVHRNPNGSVVLEPVVKIGQAFTTAGCGLPNNTLTAGTYTVLAETEAGYTLGRDMTEQERRLVIGPMQFMVKVVRIERDGVSVAQVEE